MQLQFLFVDIVCNPLSQNKVQRHGYAIGNETYHHYFYLSPEDWEDWRRELIEIGGISFYQTNFQLTENIFRTQFNIKMPS